jgi:Holliday junction resolvase RusA-like endonuclease
MKKELYLFLEGQVIPKARPRAGKGKVYTQGSYARWKDDAEASFLTQVEPLGLTGIEVHVLFINSLRGNADTDNAIGSILDSLVKTGIIVNDDVNHTPKGVASFYRDKKRKNIKRTIILIRPYTMSETEKNLLQRSYF